MKPVKLAPSARRDLASIWTYTADRWGVDQAEHYLAAIDRDMQRLGEYPEIGVRHPSRTADFRKLASGHHFIFYLVRADIVEIIRVLHERMDVALRLN